jgi:hypothetical protein
LGPLDKDIMVVETEDLVEAVHIQVVEAEEREPQVVMPLILTQQVMEVMVVNG